MKPWPAGILTLLIVTPLFADGPPVYDRVSLSTVVAEQVAQDLLVTELFAQAEGPDPAALGAKVNTDMRWAVEQAKAVDRVEVRTLDYRTQPVYRNNRVDGWRVTQALRLQSGDSDALSTLVGLLQQRLSVRRLSYEISPGARKAAEDKLIGRGISAFRERAARVTDSFGKEDYRLVEVDVNTTGRGPEPRRYASSAVVAEAAAAPPPSLEPGTRELAVEVRGTIELR